MLKQKLLIVDDDEAIRTQLKWTLGGEYDVLLAEDRPTAMILAAANRPPVMLLDLGLPPCPNSPEEGFALLSDLLGLDPRAKIIIMSGQGEKQNAIRAVAGGAFDFFCKPVETDELKLLLRRCFYVSELERESREMRAKGSGGGFAGMIGAGPRMEAVFAFVRKVATVDAPVLLLGESGTGKEMAALAIHRTSSRRNGPFLGINCNAIPENLLESELFGHEKGAFTGAHMQRSGLIESAAGGTLFLDEIGDVPASIQVKLLRFLQEKRFQHVGGRQELQADVRVLTATNVNLEEKVRCGVFREDLYFRLAVLVLSLPPLRERVEDIPLLAREFLHTFGEENARRDITFAADAMSAMARHRWPGNVRELQNRVRRGVIMAEGKRITARDLDLEDDERMVPQGTLKEARESVEREMVQRALRHSGGKISVAAAVLGVSRPTLYELMERLGIERESKVSGVH